ncbi:MAG: helix-turn-helix domain-containing protein [Myxococcota bacterium]|jgi:AcrR family transcriptional regulator|nr:helix-turn-helix domain-containing protein [Myxococcota bacterium]
MSDTQLTSRQKDIAHAALELIDQVGPQGLTTSALAHELGFTTGALFRHFNSMEHILATCVHLLTTHMHQVLTAPEPEASAPERLRGRLLRISQASAQIPGLCSFMFSTQVAHVLPQEALVRVMTTMTAGRERMLKTLEEGQKEGTIRQDLSPEQLAPVVLATMRHIIFIERSRIAERLAFAPSAEQLTETLIALLERQEAS